jgi:hypothetical protein
VKLATPWPEGLQDRRSAFEMVRSLVPLISYFLIVTGYAPDDNW